MSPTRKSSSRRRADRYSLRRHRYRRHPPKIEVPQVPQMDEVPRQNYQPPPRASFSDRVTKCLDDAAASGFGPSDREVYARSCANGR